MRIEVFDNIVNILLSRKHILQSPLMQGVINNSLLSQKFLFRLIFIFLSVRLIKK